MTPTELRAEMRTPTERRMIRGKENASHPETIEKIGEVE